MSIFFRSPDASFLAISSRDGFCSIVCFGSHELGQPFVLKEAFTKQTKSDDIPQAKIKSKFSPVKTDATEKETKANVVVTSTETSHLHKVNTPEEPDVKSDVAQ